MDGCGLILHDTKDLSMSPNDGIIKDTKVFDMFGSGMDIEDCSNGIYFLMYRSKTRKMKCLFVMKLDGFNKHHLDSFGTC